MKKIQNLDDNNGKESYTVAKLANQRSVN